MVTFYTTDCPACNVLESKMNAKNIDYETIRSEEAVAAIKSFGFSTAPVLKVDDAVMPFAEAVKWVNGQ